MLATARRYQLFALGSLAGLIGFSGPALADTASFDVLFDSSVQYTSTGSTGVTGKMTFKFTKSSLDPADKNYVLDLSIFNTSPISGNPTGTLVGFGFNTPSIANQPTSPAIKLLSYSPLTSGFGDVFGTKTNGSEANVADGQTLLFEPNPTIGNPGFEPFKNLTFCARDSGNNCVGGPANETGIADGDNKSVRFTLAALSPDLTSSLQVANSFYNLFNQWVPSLSTENDTQVALRFQQVSGNNGETSDKVGGMPGKPPSQGPTETVPGPIPLFGAAAAFGYSRRLRHRIAASKRFLLS
jgi:hypothetical protein